MRHVSIKSILAASAASTLLAGCATTLEMGPGYYHYDTRAAYDAPIAAPIEPAVAYREPVVVYREPAVVYRSARPAVTYTVPYNDHGQ